MIKFFGFIATVVLCSWLSAQEFVQPFQIQIREKFPQGTIHQAGEICHLAWRVLDAQETVVPPVFLESQFSHFTLTITQVVPGKEMTVDLRQITVTPLEYQWTLPQNEATMKYWIYLEGVPKGNAMERATGKLPIYVREFQSEMSLAYELDSCLRLLMDWNGRRGYYTHMSPAVAWHKARDACKWIRENVEAVAYQDYMAAISKVEKTVVAELMVYCPVQQAALRVDNWLVGFFQEWDVARKMYVLKIPLPVDREQFYTIQIAKGNQRYTLLHTHPGESECIAPELYDVVYLTITTEPLMAQAALEGRLPPPWHGKHVMELYAGKAQIVKVNIQNGPSLKILLHAHTSLTVDIKKSGAFYTLTYGEKSHTFIGNEVNLIGLEGK